MRVLRWMLAAVLWPGMAMAECRDTLFEDQSYTICEVAAGDDLRLFHSGPDGVYGSFGAVDSALEAEGRQLVWAMNAGMYHADLAPVGLYVENGA